MSTTRFFSKILSFPQGISSRSAHIAYPSREDSLTGITM